MITLYELHWSHFCEKIRWALDFKKLAWKKVNINAFTKSVLKSYRCDKPRYLVPFIYDDEAKVAIDDSSPILRYLDDTYPESPRLFPQDEDVKNEVYQKIVELDSILGVIGRKLGYTQIILEKPSILARLFLADKWNGLLAKKFIRNISGYFLSLLLIKRFSFEQNEARNLYEVLEQYLLPLARLLDSQNFLFNNKFTAADLTLAVYLRPLMIIPFFKEHPQLQSLYKWQKDLLISNQRESKLLYEELIEEHRKNNLPVRRKIKSISPSSVSAQHFEPVQGVAYNDHEPIWTWGILKVPYYYFIKIRQNAVSQLIASNNIR